MDIKMLVLNFIILKKKLIEDKYLITKQYSNIKNHQMHQLTRQRF